MSCFPIREVMNLQKVCRFFYHKAVPTILLYGEDRDNKEDWKVTHLLHSFKPSGWMHAILKNFHHTASDEAALRLCGYFYHDISELYLTIRSIDDRLPAYWAARLKYAWGGQD